MEGQIVERKEIQPVFAHGLSWRSGLETPAY